MKNKLVSMKINSSSRIKKYMPLYLNNTDLTIDVVSQIVEFIETAGSYPNLYISLKSIRLNQKLPITILEKLLYDLIVFKNKNILLDYHMTRTIYTESFRSSPLIFLGRGFQYNKKAFIKSYKFSSKRDDSKGIVHYRKLFEYTEDKNALNDKLNNLYSDINNSFPIFVKAATKDTVIQLVIELVGNAVEHAKAECLLDLDITHNNYTLKNSEDINDKNYFGINISILNKSNLLLFDQVKQNAYDGFKHIRGRNKNRYDFILSAYDLHKRFFDSKYSENNFWLLATMQHKISGRTLNGNSTGGTGSTTLIEALQTASSLDKCYILTGDDTVLLKKDYLKHDSNMWLGFNNSNDFTKEPNKSIFKKSKILLDGTAYNLNFIMEA